ncbi:MAG: prepilin-type N-terminal cleavage/methylation domain-containing protein [Planctomycetes bacterium]|nr:prepilin-type N-terminal cleavage/methylation domain-containing protein [Planctomycetota bacterium]
MPITSRRSTSTAADARRGAAGGQRGVTLVEVIVAVVVFALLVLTFFKSLLLVRDANAMMESHNRVNTQCQHILNRLANDVASSIRLYPDGPEGHALLGILEGVSAERLAGSLLPVLLPDGIVEKDPETDRATGNCLLFLQAESPYAYRADGSPEETLRVDVYRVVAVYLTRKDGVAGPLAEVPGGLDLVVFRSVALLDRAQVDAVADPAERERLLRLAREERHLAWLFDVRRPVLEALAGFSAEGVIEPTPPDPYEIPEDPVRAGRSLFAHSTISVATNGTPDHFGVARFAQRTSEEEGFPHGFEARVTGGSGARQVLLHLTLVHEARPSRKLAYADLNTMAVSRDF